MNNWSMSSPLEPSLLSAPSELVVSQSGTCGKLAVAHRDAQQILQVGFGPI